jgi:formyltetrahydrofolate hydrolase
MSNPTHEIKVKDHNQFRLFDYVNQPTGTFDLGDVLTKRYDDGTVEIGVVIQTFSDSEVRTDMYGVDYNHTPSTLAEIKQYRPELLDFLL